MTGTNNRIRQQAADLRTLTATLAARVGPALTAAARPLAPIDGFPSSASGATGSGGGTAELTSVEAAAARRLGDLHGAGRPGPGVLVSRLDGAIAEAVTAALRALDIVDALTPKVTALDRDLCSAAPNLPGIHIARDDGGWHDPHCHEVAEEGRTLGLCPACRRRFQRWCNRNGIPLPSVVGAAS